MKKIYWDQEKVLKIADELKKTRQISQLKFWWFGGRFCSVDTRRLVDIEAKSCAYWGAS